MAGRGGRHDRRKDREEEGGQQGRGEESAL